MFFIHAPLEQEKKFKSRRAKEATAPDFFIGTNDFVTSSVGLLLYLLFRQVLSPLSRNRRLHKACRSGWLLPIWPRWQSDVCMHFDDCHRIYGNQFYPPFKYWSLLWSHFYFIQHRINIFILLVAIVRWSGLRVDIGWTKIHTRLVLLLSSVVMRQARTFPHLLPITCLPQPPIRCPPLHRPPPSVSDAKIPLTSSRGCKRRFVRILWIHSFNYDLRLWKSVLIVYPEAASRAQCSHADPSRRTWCHTQGIHSQRWGSSKACNSVKRERRIPYVAGYLLVVVLAYILIRIFID